MLVKHSEQNHSNVVFFFFFVSPFQFFWVFCTCADVTNNTRWQVLTESTERRNERDPRWAKRRGKKKKMKIKEEDRVCRRVSWSACAHDRMDGWWVRPNLPLATPQNRYATKKKKKEKKKGEERKAHDVCVCESPPSTSSLAVAWTGLVKREGGSVFSPDVVAVVSTFPCLSQFSPSSSFLQIFMHVSPCTEPKFTSFLSSTKSCQVYEDKPLVKAKHWVACCLFFLLLLYLEIQTFLNNILATSSACLVLFIFFFSCQILCLFWFCCDAHFFFRPEKGPDDLCVSIRWQSAQYIKENI